MATASARRAGPVEPGTQSLTARSRFVTTAVGLAVALALGACGSSTASQRMAVAQTRSIARVQVGVSAPLNSPGERLPAPWWILSFDVRLPSGSRLAIGAGYGGAPITVSDRHGRLQLAIPHARSQTLSTPPGWLGAGWWHFEATNTRLAVDGRSLLVRPSSATTLSFRAQAGHPQVQALIATAASDSGSLLLHRLAELHARIPARRFPIGATRSDRIVYGDTYWTNGFWAGALWQAAAVAPYGGLFARWALTETIEHFGQEHTPTHDVGFMYGESSLAAWRALCQGRPQGPPSLCARLKSSVLGAAEELRTLAASNPVADTIPTDPSGPQAVTIVDSMMNIAILPWASRVTGDPAYARLAAHQAHVIERLLVRPNGSTAQAINFDRRTGRVLSIGTHQGLSNSSTWSRGEGWAVYGFAQAATDLHDRGLLRVAVRLADYVAAHLPPGGIPRWDYDAPAGAPVDVSAGVITGAGLFHLASACQALKGVCSRDPGRWIALGQRMLTAALGRASATPPLGYLGSQVLNERGHGCWCNGGELSFGLTYGLEGLHLEQLAREVAGPSGASRDGGPPVRQRR